MSETFGSDSFFRQMKEAQQARDRERLAALLWPHVQRMGSFILRRSAYDYYSYDDRQDAVQDAALYVYGAIDGFLDDPRNDPAAEGEARFTEKEKMSWLYRYVFNGIRHSARKVQKHQHDSLDRPATGQDDERSLGETIPAPGGAADAAFTLREQLTEACRAFFSLPNDPAVVAAVGFIILRDALRPRKTPLEAYAEALRKTDVTALIRGIEKLLKEAEVDDSVLDPLRERIDFAALPQPLRDVTAKKLANRKNSMLSALRKKRNDEKE